jgi:hypothetical protein
MSATLGTYTFLPWLRSGLANRITAPDGPGGPPVRASVRVQLELTGAALGGGGTLTRPIPRDVELYGPGDIVGIDPRSIVRTEPRHWITNFEPNYLAAIEFYDEDFPWRYTPAAPSTTGPSRLRPWIALVVLAEGEFDDVSVPGRPLPSIRIKDATALPVAAELWAWAHVHVNRSLVPDGVLVSNDMGTVLPKFAAMLAENPDLAYSRLVSPRKLAENAAYHAFVVPTFESGRLAGLGLDPTATPSATHSAWADYTGREDGSAMPYYHRWFFGTSAVGDFEYLVRKLRPKPVDPRVGTRDIDVLDPGANLPPIADNEPPGVLPLGGALRVPDEALTPEAIEVRERREQWDDPYPHPFQRALAELVNLADDYQATGSDDADPLIVPPLYARWHALTERLLTARDGTAVDPDGNWVHQLGLDPRHRVSAGFGTRVVQDGQEEYMDAAWSQVGDVLEANARIRAAQLGREVAVAWYGQQLVPLVAQLPAQATLLTWPLQARVMSGEVTAAYRVAESSTPVAPFSAATRRMLRPGGRIARQVEMAGGEAAPPGGAAPAGRGVAPSLAAQLVQRVADGEITAAPPKQVPPGVVTVDDAASAANPPGISRRLAALLRAKPWLRFAPLVLAAIAMVIAFLIGGTAAIVVGVVIAAAGVAAFVYLTRVLRQLRRADGLYEAGQTVEGAAKLPASPDFTISRPGDAVTPTTGTTDSVEARRFKTGVTDAARLRDYAERASAEPQRDPLEVPELARAVVDGLDPDRTVPRRVLSGLALPERFTTIVAEEFREAMAYPVVDVPMYRPLVDISSELFLPNLNLIEPDSITLLETNQRFIEAYMVGLNHEFARELLWREYPTDQRGSTFRQFWDVSSFLADTSDSDVRERLRDIPPLHLWPRRSSLGEHDNRQAGGQVREELVLTVRGELLKKYPNAVIYAHRARWQTHADGSIDKSLERALVDIADPAAPTRDEARTPLYEARVDPDIVFFGFDLTAKEAKGEPPEAPDDPGWFFVIKERPGEPRFGFDMDRSGALEVWNDLAWTDVLPTGKLIGVGTTTPALTLTTPSEPEKAAQHADDVQVSWGPSMTAADVAYVAYQAPVLVGVHAAEMLTPRASDSAGLPRP